MLAIKDFFTKYQVLFCLGIKYVFYIITCKSIYHFYVMWCFVLFWFFLVFLVDILFLPIKMKLSKMID